MPQLIFHSPLHISSAEFQQFSETWLFGRHITGPYRGHSDGKAEDAVEHRRSYLRNIKLKADPFAILRELRLLGRRARTTLSVSAGLLNPYNVSLLVKELIEGTDGGT